MENSQQGWSGGGGGFGGGHGGGGHDGRFNSHRNKTCNFCGKPGHIIAFCRQRIHQQQQQQQQQQQPDTTSASNGDSQNFPNRAPNPTALSFRPGPPTNIGHSEGQIIGHRPRGIPAAQPASYNTNNQQTTATSFANHGRGNAASQQKRSNTGNRMGQGQPASTHNPSFGLSTEPRANSDDVATLQAVTEHTKKLISNGDVSPEEVEAEKQHRGFRTASTSSDPDMEVATNYLRIELEDTKQKIYVYPIQMLQRPKSVDPANFPDIRGLELKDRIGRKKIFESMKTNNPTLRRLDQSALQYMWVTDYNHIWSVKPFFDDPDTQFPKDLGPDSFTGRDGVTITVDRVNLKAPIIIDLSRPVREHFWNEVETPAGNEGEAAILARGMNAFVTQLAKFRTEMNPQPVPRTQKSSKSSNKFFFLDNAHTLEGGGGREILQALRGFFVSVRPGMNDLLVNINTAFSPFFCPNQTVQQFSTNLFNLAGNGGDQWRDSILKGTTVYIVQVPNGESITREARFRRIVKIGRHPNQQANFRRQRFSIPSGQAALNGSRFTVNLGTSDAPDWYPSGWLRIDTPQGVRGVLRSQQTRNMIKFGQKKPIENAKRITTEGIRILDLDLNTSDPAYANHHPSRFGFNISHKLIKVPARVLPPPKVVYGNENTDGSNSERVKNASWNLEGNPRFPQPSAPNKSMVMFVPEDALQDWKKTTFDRVGKFMKEKLKIHGLGDVSIRLKDYTRQTGLALTYETHLENEMRNSLKKGQDAFFILPERDFDLYAVIKRIAELKMGLHTTCILSGKEEGNDRKADSQLKQVCSNIAMKCNLKGGGQNHRLHDKAFATLFPNGETASDTIVLGADVAHPLASASPGCPSIASVVGSVDDCFTHFPGSMRLQYGRQEVIAKLADMVKERLLDWAYKHGDQLPKRVLFYRDGVSESQYDEIRTTEIPQIKEAFELAQLCLNKDQRYFKAAKDDDEDKNITPVAPDKKTVLSKAEALAQLKASAKDFKLTYVVVGKRHNTRFYPTNEKQSFKTPVRGIMTVNENVQPGLCVDQVITHPYSFDFYLQSHWPIQGTGRAAHYFVLTNQMDLSPVELQEITHSFCFVYAKATRGVSYCAPAYYADRLCDRGRAYLRHWMVSHDDPLFQPEMVEGEELPEFKARIVGEIHRDTYWRPHLNNPNQPKKYGLLRRNPWHPNMDDIMFYL